MKLGTPSLVAALAVFSVGCSSTSSDQTSSVNGAVVGPADVHCASRPVGISDPNICLGEISSAPAGGASSTGGADNGAPSDTSTGGVTDCTLVHDAGYGDTHYNASGDDDDCKYHISWTSTPIVKDQSFTITVSATSKATGLPLETIPDQKPGKPALSRIEPYMPCEPTHLAPTADFSAPVTQIGAGVFSVGPVVFDKSGRWIVRFHFYEECFDSVTTPHAHAAFFMNVP